MERARVAVVSIFNLVLDGTNWYDRSLSEPSFRVLLVVLGLGGAMYGFWWLATRLVRVIRGARGAPALGEAVTVGGARG